MPISKSQYLLGGGSYLDVLYITRFENLDDRVFFVLRTKFILKCGFRSPIHLALSAVPNCVSVSCLGTQVFYPQLTCV